jgi:hypothetical protein
VFIETLLRVAALERPHPLPLWRQHKMILHAPQHAPIASLCAGSTAIKNDHHGGQTLTTPMRVHARRRYLRLAAEA